MTQPRRLLLVEDDDLLRDVTQTALTLAGYDVVAAPNGAEALEQLGPYGPFRQAPPDAILLDLAMPVMDGPTFADAYQRLPGPHAPIVVLSVRRDAAEHAQRIAAASVLPKPFNVQQLLWVVQHLARRAGEAGEARDSPTCAPSR